MELKERLQLLRKQNGYSQEQLAERLGIARQTVSKWENGQAVPEVSGFILLSDLYGVSIDRMVRDEEACASALGRGAEAEKNSLVSFLVEAKRNTYAAGGSPSGSCRVHAHDFAYQNGRGYAYLDSYLGGERFAGEEAVWLRGEPIWSMNYVGRVLGQRFHGDFLKAALMAVTEKMPYRGPELFTRGDFHYHCRVEGSVDWFQGCEDIFCGEERVYEAFFHGGSLRE